MFKCNDWLSKTLGNQQLVKELPAITDGKKTLGSKDNVLISQVLLIKCTQLCNL